MPASDRQQFIDNARTITETALRRLDEAVGATNRTAPAALSEIGTFASIFELEARLKWLGHVLKLPYA